MLINLVLNFSVRGIQSAVTRITVRKECASLASRVKNCTIDSRLQVRANVPNPKLIADLASQGNTHIQQAHLHVKHVYNFCSFRFQAEELTDFRYSFKCSAVPTEETQSFTAELLNTFKPQVVAYVVACIVVSVVVLGFLFYPRSKFQEYLI